MFAFLAARARPAGVALCCLGIAAAHATLTDAPLVTVEYVVDGDTVEIEGGERVRLLGVDAPEDKRLRKTGGGKRRLVPAQPFYIEAKRFLRDLVAKKRVRIVFGQEPAGYYGRTLAYLYLPDGTDVQRELIRRGYAMVTSYPPDLLHLRAYGEVEAEACRAGRGLWGHPHFALQTLEDGAKIRPGRGRVAGVITAVERTRTDVRLNLSGRVTLLIHRGVWRKFWPGRKAEELVGQRLIARGKVRPAGKKNTMRIRHPFMLRTKTCGAGRA